MRNVKRIFLLLSVIELTKAMDVDKEEVDKVIEDEITHKLGEDLLQSLEKKFQVDLQKGIRADVSLDVRSHYRRPWTPAKPEASQLRYDKHTEIHNSKNKSYLRQRSVDMVLLKIKILLKNGTTHIQDKLAELQDMLDVIRRNGEKELDQCLMMKQNDTSMLAEKALHQMVVCGYALIGHDPAQAVHSVMALKNMIREGMKPIYDQKGEVYVLLRVCGHDHDTLKKVIKCVISKSPIIKSAMMEITGKLIDGVVSLTKLMAHGAMHEACLIEVIKSIEDEAFLLVDDIRNCVYSNSTLTDEASKFIKENNATVLDISRKEKPTKEGNVEKKDEDMKEIIRRMLAANKGQNLDSSLKDKLLKLTNDLSAVDTNLIDKVTKKD